MTDVIDASDPGTYVDPDNASNYKSDISYTFTTAPAPSIVDLGDQGIVCLRDYLELDDIVINEGHAANFQSSGTVAFSVPEGFRFESTGSVAIGDGVDGDDISDAVLSYSNDDTRMLLTYTVSAAATAELDQMTVSGVRVRAVGESLSSATTYNLKIASATGIDGEDFATDATVASFAVNNTNLKVTLNDKPQGETGASVVSGELRICATTEIYLSGSRSDGHTGTISYFVGEEDGLGDINYTLLPGVDGNLEISEDALKDYLDNANEVYPIYVYEVIETNELVTCPRAYSDVITIVSSAQEITSTDYDFKPESTPSSIITPYVGNDIKFSHKINGGHLTAIKTIPGLTQTIEDIDPYIGNTLTISSLDIADASDNVELQVLYEMKSSDTRGGCILDVDTLDYTILPIPNIESETNLNPYYCPGNSSVIPIQFHPRNAYNTGGQYYTIISVTGSIGGAITGNVNPDWDPISDKETGFSLDLGAAYANKVGEESTLFLTVEYKGAKRIYIPRYKTDCTYTSRARYTLCYDNPSCSITYSTYDEVVANNCISNPSCSIIEIEEVSEASCSQVFIGNDIDYVEDPTIQTAPYFIALPADVPLAFTTVDREPLASVFCDGEGQVLLLGTPGSTFLDKTYELRNKDNGETQTLEEYSFSPGEAGLEPNNNGYELTYNYEVSACVFTAQMDIEIIDRPSTPQLASGLNRKIQDGTNVSIVEHCLGDDLIPLLPLDRQENYRFIWKNDLGTPIDTTTAEAFLPKDRFSSEIASEVGLYRYSVEVNDKVGECSGDPVTFYYQVGAKPSADFDYESDCESNLVFTPSVQHAHSVPNRDTLQTFTWDFELTDVLDEREVAPGSDMLANYAYATSGTYDVKLETKTSVGCIDTVTKRVTVLGKINIDNSAGADVQYHEQFDTGHGGWISTTEGDATGAKNSSWQYVDDALGQYWHADGNNDEYSWLVSPCIDISQWESPKVRADLFVDTPENEGVVLEYRVDGTDAWQAVGQYQGGYNWYNSNSILAGPGTGIVGWTGASEVNGFTTVAYSLSEVKAAAGDQMVQLRFATASLDLSYRENEPQLGQGFGLASVSIEEKKRISLLEHSTNMNAPDYEAERLLVDAFAKELDDVIYIEYHTQHPIPDELYYGYHFNSNTSNDQGAKSKNIGSTSFNGTTGAADSFEEGWVAQQYSYESLISPAFDVALEYGEYAPGEPLRVSASAVRNSMPYIPLDTASQELLLMLNIAVVEKNVITSDGKQHQNVLIKFLPDYGADFKWADWDVALGESLSAEVEWQVPVAADPNQFALIAWVEKTNTSKDNKITIRPEILQAVQVDIDESLVAVPVTAVETLQEPHYTLYPVPAHDQLMVSKKGQSIPASGWAIHNVFGQEVAAGSTRPVNGALVIDLSDLGVGTYILQLRNSEGQFYERFVKR
ncbi:T9SS type A sorting domain-containing protein [Reichenbachiella carrageenanivorans]|uniref:T9SS type A sorting domain-containing protein n=1 Tax=Reichenbachiella carrageenanivorans TaxID=2979869 RepID=A0ABY6CWG7_9BACT|nr:T9SS type A sorting domain-containing protein [Reichenbachiella carrageenanivorans]UXX77745.1 T9SS type A sorting domain-containing protein [Reichenbachiella carrageenanivorans]